VFVRDQDGELGFVCSLYLDQTAHSENLALAGFGVLMLGYKRHFVVVVDEADSRQSFVGRSLVQVHHMEISKIDAALGKRFVEFDHHRLVFGTYGTNEYLSSVLHHPRRDVLDRIRSYCRLRKIFALRLKSMNDYTRVERNERRVGSGEQRIDVDLLDPRLLDDESAEADNQLFERG